jgi:hypothetical protein
MLRLMRLINEWAAGDGRPDQNWAISPIGLREETFIVVVTAHPEPCDRIAFKYTNRAATKCYSDGPDVFLVIDTLEMQRGMKGVLCPQAIGFPGSALDSLVERPVCRPE